MTNKKSKDNQNHTKIIVAVAVIGVLFIGLLLSRCGGPSGEEKSEIADLLWTAGVNPTTLEIDGDDATIEIETSDAINFKDELIIKWGRIFGILQGYADNEVVIVNTVEGQPVATVAAKSEDIKAFVHGGLTREEFFDKIKIEAE